MLVDDHDQAIGSMPKVQAHRVGALHRAVSVVLVDREGRVLLQQRAAGKYHSPGLWTNSCCGHPRPGESAHDAAARRLAAELGLACNLEPVAAFRYRADLADGMVEHEIDHVFLGRCDAAPAPDPSEVAAWRRVPMDVLLDDIGANPGRYTAWLPAVLETLRAHPLVAPSGDAARRRDTQPPSTSASAARASRT